VGGKERKERSRCELSLSRARERERERKTGLFFFFFEKNFRLFLFLSFSSLFTDRRHGREHLADVQLVEDGGLARGVEAEHDDLNEEVEGG
jgi:hypothetical protein